MPHAEGRIAHGNFIDAIAVKFSLANLNAPFETTLKNAFSLKPLFACGSLLEKLAPSQFSPIGDKLQALSFAICVMLFGLIGLPQFASDKFGLAFVVLAGLGCWVLGRLLHGKERRRFDAIDALVLAYLAANIVAAFASHYFGPSLKGLTKVFIYIGSYFLFTATLAGSLKRKLIVIGMAILCAALLSLYGLYQYKIGVAPLATWEDPSIEGGGGTRIFATLGNPNLLAGLLVPLVPVSLGLAIGCFASARQKKGGKIWYVLTGVMASVSALLAVATVLTQSRGGLLGMIGGFAFILYIGSGYLWKNFARIRMVIVVGVIAAVIGGGLLIKFHPAVNQRFASIFAGREHSSNSYRLNVYSSSLKMFRDNWWIGTGPGNETFRQAYGLYMVSSYDALGTYCVPLEVAVETGLPGLIAFFGMLFCVMARAHVKFWTDDSEAVMARWLAGALAAGIGAMMIHGMVDTVFYRPQVHFLFWLMIALMVTPDKCETMGV